MTCILDRVLVPIASEDDAEATASTIESHMDRGTAVFVHVIEKAGGAPDKASVEQREEYAEKVFEVIRQKLENTEIEVEESVKYGTDVGDTIIKSAHDHRADSIAFTPRSGSKILKLLTGDITDTLVQNSDIPLVILPHERDED